MERTTTTTTSTAHRNAETTARENADDLCRFPGLDCAGGQGRSVPPKGEGPTQEINRGSPAVCHDGLRPERSDHLPLGRPASSTLKGSLTRFWLLSTPALMCWLIFRPTSSAPPGDSGKSTKISPTFLLLISRAWWSCRILTSPTSSQATPISGKSTWASNCIHKARAEEKPSRGHCSGKRVICSHVRPRGRLRSTDCRCSAALKSPIVSRRTCRAKRW